MPCPSLFRRNQLPVALPAVGAQLVDLGAEPGGLGAGLGGGLLGVLGAGALLIAGGDDVGGALVEHLPFPVGG